MKFLPSFKSGLALCGLLLALGSTTVARAVAYTVNLDTSAVVNHAAGPFYLDFQSIFGSGADQTITLSNFSLTGGGFVAGTEGSFGTVNGDLASSLVIASGATSVYNEFWQQFEATVTAIKFTVDLSAQPAAGTPTSFAVMLLDGANLFAIPTNGFADTLVLFNIDGSNTAYETATSIGDTAGVSASVPETGATFGLVAAGLGLLGVARRRCGLAAVSRG